jgi:hypothetical protein
LAKELLGGRQPHFDADRQPLEAAADVVRRPGELFRRRTVGAIALLALVPAAVAIPALAALALVSAVCSLVVTYEVIRYRAARVRVRHPELAE